MVVGWLVRAASKRRVVSKHCVHCESFSCLWDTKKDMRIWIATNCSFGGGNKVVEEVVITTSRLEGQEDLILNA